MEGPDVTHWCSHRPRRFAGREQAAEISENYWMALLRRLFPTAVFSQPGRNAAAADLSLYGSILAELRPAAW